MQKLKKEFGRAYLLGYLTVTATFVLTVIALWQHPNQYQFVLAFWTEFIKYFVVPLVGAKALEKIGTAFANRRNNIKATSPETKTEGETK